MQDTPETDKFLFDPEPEITFLARRAQERRAQMANLGGETPEEMEARILARLMANNHVLV
jgi:hypothetical protein